MKKLLVITSLMAFSLSLFGCGSSAPKVEVDPDMQGFINMLDGSASQVQAALASYGASDEIAANDMGMYDLANPVVTAKVENCYSLEAAAGVTTRMYDVCRTEGKISSLVDKGMK